MGEAWLKYYSRYQRERYRRLWLRAEVYGRLVDMASREGLPLGEYIARLLEEKPAVRGRSGDVIPVDSPAFELDGIICSYDPVKRKSYCFDRGMVVELVRELNKNKAGYDEAEKDPRVKTLHRLDILCVDGTNYWWICSERKDDPEFRVLKW